MRKRIVRCTTGISTAFFPKVRDTAVPPLDGSRIWPFLFPQLRLSGGNYSWLLGALVLAAVWFGALDVVFDLSLDLVDSLAGLR